MTDIVWICSMGVSLFGDNDPEEATRVCRVVQIANAEGGAVLLGDMGLLAARRGDMDEARALLAEQHRLEPNAPETYLTAATFANQIQDYESMVEHAVKALSLETDQEYWNITYTRLAKIFIATDRQDDLDAVKRRIQLPIARPPRLAISKAPAHSTRVGRNDPCPCGSGKKYKKCHGA